MAVGASSWRECVREKFENTGEHILKRTVLKAYKSQLKSWGKRKCGSKEEVQSFEVMKLCKKMDHRGFNLPVEKRRFR